MSSLEQTGLTERSWNALVAQGDTNSIFQTHQWNRSWWSTFGARYEPMLVTIANGSGTVGVAPFVVEQIAKERIVRFLGDGRADYCDLLAAGNPETVAAMFDTIDDYRHWDIIEMNNVPAMSATVEMVTNSCSRLGYRVLVTEQFLCPTLLIKGHEPAAQAILNKPSLRRRERRLDRVGRLTFRDLMQPDDVEAYMDAFFKQHIRRWKESPTPSLFLEGANQAFYRTLAENLSGTGWLLFSVVAVDDTPIAFHYGFDYDDVVTWYKPSFDIRHAQWSPGLVMIKHLLGYAIGQNRRELDFTIGDESFKRRFTNHVRKTVRIQVFKDPARFAVERPRQRLAAAIRRASMFIRSGLRS